MILTTKPIRLTFNILASASLSLALPCIADSGDEPSMPTSEVLAATCVECHGDGKAAIPGWPPIKFMSREEITTRLTAYRDQRMPGSRMNDVTHRFSDEDIEAIAEYFARRRLQPHE